MTKNKFIIIIINIIIVIVIIVIIVIVKNNNVIFRFHCHRMSLTPLNAVTETGHSDPVTLALLSLKTDDGTL